MVEVSVNVLFSDKKQTELLLEAARRIVERVRSKFPQGVAAKATYLETPRHGIRPYVLIEERVWGFFREDHRLLSVENSINPKIVVCEVYNEAFVEPAKEELKKYAEAVGAERVDVTQYRS